MPKGAFVAGFAGLFLMGCDPAERMDAGGPPPEYGTVETRLLDDDLVQFIVTVEDPRSPADLTAFADCAAAQYALVRGYNFARHLRTNLREKGSMWVADAVYTISPALPQGLRTLDAEVIVAACQENGIPTV